MLTLMSLDKKLMEKPSMAGWWWMKEVRMLSRKCGHVVRRLSESLFLGQQDMFTKQLRSEHHWQNDSILDMQSTLDY